MSRNMPVFRFMPSGKLIALSLPLLYNDLKIAIHHFNKEWEHIAFIGVQDRVNEGKHRVEHGQTSPAQNRQNSYCLFYHGVPLRNKAIAHSEWRSFFFPSLLPTLLSIMIFRKIECNILLQFFQLILPEQRHNNIRGYLYFCSVGQCFPWIRTIFFHGSNVSIVENIDVVRF